MNAAFYALLILLVIIAAAAFIASLRGHGFNCVPLPPPPPPRDCFDGEENDEIVDAINELRDGIADSVTLMNDNDDPPPTVAIECSGEWTNYETRRFEGDSVLDCLKAAVIAKRTFQKAEHYGPK